MVGGAFVVYNEGVHLDKSVGHSSCSIYLILLHLYIAFSLYFFMLFIIIIRIFFTSPPHTIASIMSFPCRTNFLAHCRASIETFMNLREAYFLKNSSCTMGPTK